MICSIFPEPRRDIEAQICALHDRAHSKVTVYIAPGSPIVPSCALTIKRDEGIINTIDERVARFWYDKAEIDDADIAMLLGYPEPKSSIINPIIVQARDVNDCVVTEAMVSFHKLMPHSAIIAQHIPQGGRLVFASVFEVLQRRAELRQ